MAERQGRQSDHHQRAGQRGEGNSVNETSKENAQRPHTGERRAIEAANRLTETGRDMAHEGGRTMRRSAENTQRGLAAAEETMRHGTEKLGEGTRQFADTAADQFERMGETLAEASRDAAENARLLMSLPTGNVLREWQKATSSLIDRVVETNLHIAQELFQRSNPAELVSMQQRFIRDYLQTFTMGSRQLFKAAQQLAEEAERPMERPQYGGERGNGRRSRGRGTVADVMKRDVRTAEPNDTVQDIARRMTEEDTGALPVREGDRLVGMVTDRDIATRLVAEGKDPSKTPVREVMTSEVKYVFEDEDLEHVAENMAEQQLRRLPVMNRQKRLVGIVSLGDMASHRAEDLAGRALVGVARPGGQHQQGGEDEQRQR